MRQLGWRMTGKPSGSGWSHSTPKTATRE